MGWLFVVVANLDVAGDRVRVEVVVLIVVGEVADVVVAVIVDVVGPCVVVLASDETEDDKEVGGTVIEEEAVKVDVADAGVLSEVVDIVGEVRVEVSVVVAASVIVVSAVFVLEASDEVAADVIVEGTIVVAEVDFVCAVLLSEVVDLTRAG